MCGIFTVVAGGVRLQHPIGTTCQCGLSLPAYIIRGTFVLSPCNVFGHSFMVIALTALVMASTIFSGLNRSFNILFSLNALFSLSFTVVISVAWASILFYLFWELWDNCCYVSLLSTATDVVCTTFAHLPLLLSINANQPQNWVELSESGKTNIVPWLLV